MFSDSTLNEIRSRCDIVDVIGRYVSLKKSGQGYQGLCPFHNEKTPSFHVHPGKQVYRCFGSCAKGGNVFTFIMEHDGLSFPEAVRKLAGEVGVRIEETNNFVRQPQKPVSESHVRASKALELAAKYFHHLLTQNKDYAFALRYLKERGLTQKSIEKFRLGVSPIGWNNLIQVMTQRGFKWEDLLLAGLVVPKEDSKYQGYDRFRERLMFPILDKNGSVVGFGARALKEGDEPKYLNSPDTSFFNKSRILYGLCENQREIRLKREALIVEGYMDVVGLYEAGVCNAVAPMGTALTVEHCREIKTLTQKVVTVFDPDAAGISAWHRSMPIFLETGLFAKDVTLPQGLDPDEFVKKGGAEKFYELCDKAPQQVTKYLKEIADKGILGEKDRERYLQELIPILVASRRLPDKGAVLWDDVSRLLGISFDAIKKLVQESPARNTVPAPAPAPARPPVRSSAAPKKLRQRKLPLDWAFFKGALQYPENFFAFDKENWVGFLKDPELESLLVRIWDTQSSSKMLEILEELAKSQTCPEVLDVISETLLKDIGTQPSPEPQLFTEVAKRISERRRKAQIHGIANQVRMSQRLGDSEEQIKLLEELRKLRVSGPVTQPPTPSSKTGPRDH